ncbi:hypothetical protein SARC_02741 [Sphaeroforma arctica JP610]|uniref:Uncharacterized protein n=1 Tax=Sphaeroforma arctica JP610 TaxID=667725 RepID=A0A0L0G9W9_9EUKA|nr:hypothetical protein SARC_02741 [Sphaeroforma arctica JP610]KNC85048.1 hypothetical protein SARC_02741 [Sphaeroforma arctica JP610]|eukprot:XP_014158950.1 hypothetical protein SARC_02741 [Sphaeroforma arctica JP610]
MTGAKAPALALSLSLVDKYSEGQLSAFDRNDDEDSEGGSEEEAGGTTELDPERCNMFISIDSNKGFDAKLKITAISSTNILNLLI